MSAVLDVLLTFIKIGIISFGGGYGMISIIFNETERLGITVEQFADLTAIDLVVPGPIAINASTYVGFLHSGIWGALAATIGVCLPGYVIVLLVMRAMDKFKRNTLLQGFLSGVKPAAVGLIAAAAVAIALGVLMTPGAALPFSPVAAAIFLAVTVASIVFSVDPILLTVLAGIAGAFLLK